MTKATYGRKSLFDLRVPEEKSIGQGRHPEQEAERTCLQPEDQLAVGRGFKLSKVVSGDVVPLAGLRLPITSLNRATTQRASVQRDRAPSWVTLLSYMGR